MVFASRAWVIAVALASSACGPKLEVTLEKGAGAPSIPFVELIFKKVPPDDGVRFGPEAIGQIGDENFEAEIPQNTKFFIDALGCSSKDETSCTLAEGCSGFDSLDNNPLNLKAVKITLLAKTDPKLDCPPAPPAK